MSLSPSAPIRICVLGACNVDFTFHAPRLPILGETLPGHSFLFHFGGKGANQAVMACRMGAQATLISRVGDDAFGEQMLAHLRKEGLDVSRIGRSPGLSTGAAAILIDDSARNAIIGVAGANLTVTANDIIGATLTIISSQALIGTLEVPLEPILLAFGVARANGVTTILNPAPAFDVPDELLQNVDYCIPNETELAHIAGGDVSTLEGTERAARRLLQRGAKNVIVTLAERGALIVTPEIAEQIPGIPVKAVETSGAGDAFIGSFAVFLAEGLPVSEAVRGANAIAAASVTRAGTQASFPRRNEL
ncbi:MAG TPA: ribokinase [Gemmataceae bacterium]|jgi:ribokinase|nr:ribokinase [Gemmataceae bacterium]